MKKKRQKDTKNEETGHIKRSGGQQVEKDEESENEIFAQAVHDTKGKAA